MKIETTRKRMVMFSTISLTDIVLLLLIFFLLTSSFVVQPGIKVKLPKAASGQQDDASKIYITVTRDEQIFVNQNRISRAELATLVRQLLNENPERLVVIKADKDLSLEKAIQIVDTARLAGAQRFMIATEPGL
ncbi:MAG TPA: biopolymer transporter ExbD [bacterium]|nr:biopolymer transporter ExbD [bacterium]HPN43645.1 biopolymer transporter ExbD [bacterium]